MREGGKKTFKKKTTLHNISRNNFDLFEKIMRATKKNKLEKCFLSPEIFCFGMCFSIHRNELFFLGNWQQSNAH